MVLRPVPGDSGNVRTTRSRTAALKASDDVQIKAPVVSQEVAPSPSTKPAQSPALPPPPPPTPSASPSTLDVEYRLSGTDLKEALGITAADTQKLAAKISSLALSERSTAAPNEDDSAGGARPEGAPAAAEPIQDLQTASHDPATPLQPTSGSTHRPHSPRARPLRSHAPGDRAEWWEANEKVKAARTTGFLPPGVVHGSEDGTQHVRF